MGTVLCAQVVVGGVVDVVLSPWALTSFGLQKNGSRVEMRSLWLVALTIAVLVVVFSCSDDGREVKEVTVDPAPSKNENTGPANGGREVKEVTVGPELLDCVGVGPMKCLEVDGGLFYETIHGFDYEEGYTYRLKIEQYEAYPGREEPPQDASKYGYRLIDVLSKTQTP